MRGKAMIGPRRWIAGLVVLVAAAVAPPGVGAQLQGPSDEAEVTFARDIAPILQENCVTCHREGGVAPMPLVTYEQVRAFAPLMKYKTGLRDRAGTMPPYYLERDLGIQDYGPEILMLDDEEIAKIAMWADHGAPQGNPMDAPPPLEFDDQEGWAFEPDLTVRSGYHDHGSQRARQVHLYPVTDSGEHTHWHGGGPVRGCSPGPGVQRRAFQLWRRDSGSAVDRSPPDLFDASARSGGGTVDGDVRRDGCRDLARPRSGAECRRLSRRRGAAAAGGLGDIELLVASLFERTRDHASHGDRLQIPSEGLPGSVRVAESW